METTSPAGMLAFYSGTLELPVIADADDETAVRAGATVLRFGQAPPGTRPSYHFALRISAPAFDDAKAWLAARIELVREDGQDEFDWDVWGARAVYILDPAGNVVELMAFPELDPADGSGFRPDSYVGVAELGFPVGDPHATATELARTFGIGLWDRDHVTPDRLTPVGEQGATFLLSPLGREWLFGGPAADHPLEVVLGGVQKGRVHLAPHPYRLVGAP